MVAPSTMLYTEGDLINREGEEKLDEVGMMILMDADNKWPSSEK
jgi:hypothetical protein